MRTTLNLDDDVLEAARERARRQGQSIGEVVSQLVRQALAGRRSEGEEEEELHGFRPLPARGRLVTNTIIDALREAEAE